MLSKRVPLSQNRLLQAMLFTLVPTPAILTLRYRVERTAELIHPTWAYNYNLIRGVARRRWAKRLIRKGKP